MKTKERPAKAGKKQEPVQDHTYLGPCATCGEPVHYPGAGPIKGGCQTRGEHPNTKYYPRLSSRLREGGGGALNRVYLSSNTNSQMFTVCCSTAICRDEGCCPRCKQEVYPGNNVTDHERERMRWQMAYRDPRGLK